MADTKKCFAAIGAAIVVIDALDLLRLGMIAKPMYQHAIGHLMAESPNIPADLVFHAAYWAGLVAFAVVPRTTVSGVGAERC